MREPRLVGYSLTSAVALLAIVLTIVAYAVPVVQITKPADKEVISGSADIQVVYAADGSSPIVRLEVYLDNQRIKDFRIDQPRMQGTQSLRWDFTIAAPSMHSISARAMDATGAVGTTAIRVTVRRQDQPAAAPGGAPVAPAAGPDRTPPTVDIYYPADGQVVSGELQVKADVSDNVGVRTVVFYLDGRFKTMMINSANYVYHVDTAKMQDGTHVVSASAWDTSDNEGQAQPRSFVVRNNEATAPQGGDSRVSRTAPVVPPVAPAPSLSSAPPAPPLPPAPERVAKASGPGLTSPPTATTARPDPLAQLAGAQSLMNAIEMVSPASAPAVEQAVSKISAPGTTLVASRPTPTPQPSAASLPMLPGAASTAAVSDAPTASAGPRSSTPQQAGLPRAIAAPGTSRPVDLEPGTASAAAVAEGASAPAADPRTSMPANAGLPKHVAAAAPSAQPRLDGLVASLPLRPEAEAAAGAAPASPSSSPLAGTGGHLPSLSPVGQPTTMVAKLSSAAAPRSTAPAGAGYEPKTAPARGDLGIVLAAPNPESAYVPGPVGSPRGNMVAMLPPKQAESDPTGKTGRPGELTNVAAMSQFKDVKVVFNGDLLSLRTAPMLVQGISTAALREIFEHTDGQLYWYHVEKRVHAVNGHTDIQLQIGDKSVRVNGSTEELPLAPFIRNGRTMLPLDFIARTLDVTVSFNSQTGELIISSNKF